MKNESKIIIKIRRNLRKTRRLDLLIVVLVIVCLFSIPILLNLYIDINENNLGIYGDFFGSINAFVSALAFAGLIYTIILQRKDLQMQKEELQLTREELKRQATAQENSANKQADQVELIKDQINKDIRPYINAYWEFRNGYIFLTIKNIGKCACSDFQIKSESFNTDNLDQEYKSALDELVTRIQNLKISIFPSSIDYAVALTNRSITRITDIGLLRALSKNNIYLTCTFSFIFRGQTEVFTITYDFKSIELFENEDIKFHKDLIKELQEIKNNIVKIKKV